MHISTVWRNRAVALKEKFCKFGECDGTFLDKIPQHAPESLRALLSVAGEWHIMPDSYGVYGCNLFEKGTFLSKVSIIGDEELVEEWKDEHNSPNCGEEGWECIAAVSEYDYIFVCIDPNSLNYGYTRHIVNNCDEDNSFLNAPFDVFFEHLESYAEKWVCQYSINSEDEEDLPDFLSL